MQHISAMIGCHGESRGAGSTDNSLDIKQDRETCGEGLSGESIYTATLETSNDTQFVPSIN